MGAGDLFILERRDDNVGFITLNRPDVHNAFDDRLISELTSCLKTLAVDKSVRVLVLTGKGKSFSAGADLNWMRRMASYGQAENLADARHLADLMAILNDLPFPTIAKVNGAALGGGMGLVCCCDIAITNDQAVFGTTEVRLGLIPAVIGPYVIAAIGSRQARRLMLTGERFDAAEALRIGLVHQLVAAEELDRSVEVILGHILASGPRAIEAGKSLIHDLSARPIDDQIVDETAKRIARLRATEEAKEGLSAFLEKRQPAWCVGKAR